MADKRLASLNRLSADDNLLSLYQEKMQETLDKGRQKSGRR